MEPDQDPPLAGLVRDHERRKHRARGCPRTVHVAAGGLLLRERRGCVEVRGERLRDPMRAQVDAKALHVEPGRARLLDQRLGVVEAPPLAENPLAQAAYVAITAVRGLFGGRLDGHAGRERRSKRAFEPDQWVERCLGHLCGGQPFADQTRGGSGAELPARPGALVQQVTAEPSHHETPSQTIPERDHQTADRGLHRPRPRAGGIGVTANLHHRAQNTVSNSNPRTGRDAQPSH